jgi:hypothetical protein
VAQKRQELLEKTQVLRRDVAAHRLHEEAEEGGGGGGGGGDAIVFRTR